MTDDELQTEFRLLFLLHRNRDVALSILLNANDCVATLRKAEARRGDSKDHYKEKVAEVFEFQFGTYAASVKWELDQESAHPKRKPWYRPTADDRLVRYWKHLVWKSMDRPSRYAALAFGVLHYTYQSNQISNLCEDLFGGENVRRLKKWWLKQLAQRFQGESAPFDEHGRVILVRPDGRQRELAHTSLSILAPWGTCAAAPVRTQLLVTYFIKDSRHSESERLHVLCDPMCGGIARLVREFNSVHDGRYNSMRLDDPEDKLGVPKFGGRSDRPSREGGGGGAGGDGGPDDTEDRFNPAPLTPYELASIRESFERNEQRRKIYDSGRLRVYVDGEQVADFAHDYFAEPFVMPDTASCVEVYGEDGEGELLLAVFRLAATESGDGVAEQELSVTHEGGQTITLSVSPGARQTESIVQSLARLEYVGPPTSDPDPDENHPDESQSVVVGASGFMAPDGGAAYSLSCGGATAPREGRHVFIAYRHEGAGREHAELLSQLLSWQNIQTKFGERLGDVRQAATKLAQDVSLVVPIITLDMAAGTGKNHTTQWIQQELGFAAPPSVPFLFVIEEGAPFGETDTGSIERIRFPSGKFPDALGRIVNQITALQRNIIVTRDLPEADLSDRVWRLILEAREQAAKGDYEKFLKLSEETIKLDPTAWRAALNVGVALVKLGRLADAERVFLHMLESFEGNDQARALVYHNLGWREQVRSAGDYKNVRSLRAEAAYYEKALGLMHSKTHTRASLIQCKVLLGELGEASALLMQSLNYRGFLEALRYETEHRGYLGHQILRQLPESEWLYPLLFPVWHAADDELRDNNRLV